MSYLVGSINGVSQIVAGSNVTISPTSGYGSVTINGSAGGGSGISTGVLSLAYTTGINGSGSNGNITLSNTGVRSLTAGSGIGISGTTGAITISNTQSALTLNGGSNITITNTSTINVSANPVFSNSMGFTGPTGNNVFCNVVYPFGTPDYYPYVYSGSGTNVNNTLGGKQFWAVNVPGSSTCNVMKYSFNGINAQQGTTGSTIPFMSYNDTTGLFGLSNTSNVVNSNIAGTGISVSGATGNVTITNTGVTSLVAGSNITLTSTLGAFTINSSGGAGGVTSLAYTTGITGSASTGAITLSNTGVTSFSLVGSGGLYNLGSSTAPQIGALVVDVLSGPGISVGSSSGNKTISNTGVISLTAGSNISITSTGGAYTINSSSGGGGSSSIPRAFVYTAQAPYQVDMTGYRQHFALDSFGENTISCGFDATAPYVINFSTSGVYHFTWKLDLVTGDQSADFVGGCRLSRFDNSYVPSTCSSTTKYRFKNPQDMYSFCSTAIVPIDITDTKGVGLEVWVDSGNADITPPAHVRVTDLSALLIDDCAIQMSILRLGDYTAPAPPPPPS